MWDDSALAKQGHLSKFLSCDRDAQAEMRTSVHGESSLINSNELRYRAKFLGDMYGFVLGAVS